MSLATDTLDEMIQATADSANTTAVQLKGDWTKHGYSIGTSIRLQLLKEARTAVRDAEARALEDALDKGGRCW